MSLFNQLFKVSAASTDLNAVTTASRDSTGAKSIFVVLSEFTGSDSTISDNKGNTYTGLTKQSVGGDKSIRIFYCNNPAVGTGHTWSNSANSAPILTVMGYDTAITFDAENGTSQTGSSTSLATGSVTPAQADSLCIAGLAIAGVVPGVNSPFTLEYGSAGTSGQSYGIGVASLVQTSAVAANATFTYSSTVEVAAAIACFDASTAQLCHGSYVGSPERQTIDKTSPDYPQSIVIQVAAWHPTDCKIQWRTDSTGSWTDVTTRNARQLFEITLSASDYTVAAHLLNVQAVATGAGLTLTLPDLAFTVTSGQTKVKVTAATSAASDFNTIYATNVASVDHLEITLPVFDYNFADKSDNPASPDYGGNTDAGYVKVIGNGVGSHFIDDGSGEGFHTNNVWLKNLKFGGNNWPWVLPVRGNASTSNNVSIVLEGVTMEQSGADSNNFLVRDYTNSDFLKFLYFINSTIVLATGPMNESVFNCVSNGGTVVAQNAHAVVDLCCLHVYDVFDGAHPDCLLANSNGYDFLSRVVQGLTAVDPLAPYPLILGDLNSIMGRGVNLVEVAVAQGVQMAVINCLAIPGNQFSSDFGDNDGSTLHNLFLQDCVLKQLQAVGSGDKTIYAKDVIAGFTALQRSGWYASSGGNVTIVNTNKLICPWVLNATTIDIFQTSGTPVTSGLDKTKWSVRRRGGGASLGNIVSIAYLPGIDFVIRITMDRAIPATANFVLPDLEIHVDVGGYLGADSSPNTAQTATVDAWRNFSPGPTPTFSGYAKSSGYLILDVL